MSRSVLQILFWWCGAAAASKMKEGFRVPVLFLLLCCGCFFSASCSVCGLVLSLLEFFLLSCSLWVCVISLGGLRVLSDFRRMRLWVLSDFRRVKCKRKSHALKGKEGLLL
jgi:hypothetical protein